MSHTYSIIASIEICNGNVSHPYFLSIVSYGCSWECEKKHIHRVDVLIPQARGQPGSLWSTCLERQIVVRAQLHIQFHGRVILSEIESSPRQKVTLKCWYQQAQKWVPRPLIPDWLHKQESQSQNIFDILSSYGYGITPIEDNPSPRRSKQLGNEMPKRGLQTFLCSPGALESSFRTGLCAWRASPAARGNPGKARFHPSPQLTHGSVQIERQAELQVDC